MAVLDHGHHYSEEADKCKGALRACGNFCLVWVAILALAAGLSWAMSLV